MVSLKPPVAIMNIHPIFVFISLLFLSYACKEKNLHYMEEWGEIEESFVKARLEREKRIFSIKMDAPWEIEAQKIRGLTQRENDKFSSIMRSLETLNGMDQGVGNEELVNALNQRVPESMLVEVEKTLDEFVEELNKISKNILKKTFPKLTITEGGKSFYQENFEGEPLVAVMAQINIKQYEVLGYVEEIMMRLYEIRKYNQLTNNGRKAYWYPRVDSDIIEESQPLKVRLCQIMYHTRTQNLKIKINGEDIPVINGVGKIRLKPTGTGIQKLIGEVSFIDSLNYEPYFEKRFTNYYYVLPNK